MKELIEMNVDLSLVTYSTLLQIFLLGLFYKFKVKVDDKVSIWGVFTVLIAIVMFFIQVSIISLSIWCVLDNVTGINPWLSLIMSIIFLFALSLHFGMIDENFIENFKTRNEISDIGRMKIFEHDFRLHCDLEDGLISGEEYEKARLEFIEQQYRSEGKNFDKWFTKYKNDK